MNSKHLKIALITSCFVGASGALAQTTASAEAPAAAAAEEFADEIIVTAQRRSQRYVDVPTSVSVTTGDQLAAAGANGSRDLDLLTPGLNITQQGTYVQPTIRGVGTTVTGTGADPNIAIYVDGVYLSGQGTALFEFNNIAQIEVLKGPQGALYGRNATGGAIVVSTVAPSLGEASGEFEASYGRFDDFRATAHVNVPVSETVAFNLSAYNHTNEGYTNNVFLNEKSSYTKSRGIRGRILFEPSDSFRAILSGTRVYQSDNTAYSYLPVNNNTPFRTTQAAALGRAGSKSDISLNIEPVNKLYYTTANLNAEWSGDWGTVTSISSYTHTKYPFTTDLDGTELNVQHFRAAPQTQETETQEIIYASPEGERFSWIGGLFYLHDSSRTKVTVFVNGTAPPAPPFQPDTYVKADAYAAYAEGTFDITPELHLTLGGRYSTERKRARNTNGIGGALMLDASETFKDFTPRAALRYDLSPSSSTYLSYSEGFKSGLFDAGNTGTCNGTNLANPATCPFAGTVVEPEKVRSYEVGYKYSEGGLLFSTAAFYSRYKNIQINALNPLNQQILFNAAEAEIYGADVELGWQATDNFDLRAGAAYTHGEYVRFPVAQLFAPLPTGGNRQFVGDASGNDLIRTPEFTAFGSATYTQDVGAGEIEANTTVSYSSSFFWHPDNRLKQPAFAIVNARLSYLPTENLKFSIFGENLTNRRTQLYVREATIGDFISYSKPRSWGVSGAVKF